MYNEGFLYASNDTGCHLAKVGSGYHGTLPGYVYSRSSQCLETGLFVEINGNLLHRPSNLDNGSQIFCYTLDPISLNRNLEFRLSEDLLIQRGEVKTIVLLKMSGNVVLWIRQVTSDNEMLNYLPQAYVSVADFCSVSFDTQQVSLMRRKLLLKSPESQENVDRIMNLLTTPKKTQEDDNQVKFPADSLSSSCGLRLTTLQESAFTNCDKFLTVMAPNPDCRAKNSKNLGIGKSMFWSKISPLD